jgi:hypothetical protein
MSDLQCEVVDGSDLMYKEENALGASSYTCPKTTSRPKIRPQAPPEW